MENITGNEHYKLIEDESVTADDLISIKKYSHLLAFKYNFVTASACVSNSLEKYINYKNIPYTILNNRYDADLFLSDDLINLNSFYDELNKNDFAQTDVRLKTISGDYIWTRIFVEIIRDEAGVKLNAFAYFSDMQEMISEIQANENKTNSIVQIFNNLPIGICLFTFDTDFVPVYASDNACKIFGYTHEECLECIKAKQCVPFLNVSEISKEEKELIFSGKTVERVIRALRKDGTPFWLKFICKITKLINDEIFITAIQDVTRQTES